jgi:hypothetical protein
MIAQAKKEAHELQESQVKVIAKQEMEDIKEAYKQSLVRQAQEKAAKEKEMQIIL